MATNNFVLRCKTEKGAFTLTDLSNDSTVEDLKLNLTKLTAVNPESMKFLSGYPPKPLATENGSLKLFDLNIHSGDTLIMEIQKVISENVPEGAAVGAQGNNIQDLMNQSAIMMRHVVPANNSCLFTSIEFILSNNGNGNREARDLRGIIANVVRNNPAKYSEGFLEKPNHEYCAWITDPTHWGGAIELSILSEYFGMEIVAINILSLSAHRFGEANDYQNRIFLIYDGIHYDPLVLEYGDHIQTVFSAYDERPMDMAMELAREAKESRQFTDVINYNLSCKSCHIRMRGNRGAYEHASYTGHCEFGEV
ncbi:ubiquitin thioesterase OTU1 [Trichonephila clavata]|uniref:Ubiquitin thioesterase OTU n=1 Tax=Trichonephila clavata TaxID=2740835 RepID=A0A8X6LVD9_TRICU|nr:ubiquitin thioesterase OTU1 [Trichonephila clavata]